MKTSVALKFNFKADSKSLLKETDRISTAGVAMPMNEKIVKY